MIFFRDYYYFNSNINWPDSSVYFWGPYDGQVQGIGVAAETNVQHELPVAVTVVGVEIRNSVSGTLASSETSQFDLYINSGASVQSLGTLAMTASYNFYSDHTLGISLGLGDTFSIRCTNPVWATNPTNMFGMTVRLYFDTGVDDNLYLKVFRSGAAFSPAIRTTYYFNGSGHTSYQTSENFYWQAPYSGIIRHASLCCKGAGTSTDTINTYVNIETIPTQIGSTLQYISGSNREMVTGLNIPFSGGDRISVSHETPNAWSGSSPTQICVVNDLLIEKTSN